MSRKAARRAIAQEAARLMVEEDVKEYITAKAMAADIVLGARSVNARFLPSNGEIRQEVVARGDLVHRVYRLRQLREVALAVMRALAAFEPRLIGSVATGAIHSHSDIDIQCFVRRHDALEEALRLNGYEAERLEHLVFKDARWQRFVHYHFDTRGAHVELSVYEPPELHVVRFSSVDGKPIDRVPTGRLLALLARS